MATGVDQHREIRPRDFLDVDGCSTTRSALIRDTVRAFVAERVLPNVGDWFEEGDAAARELAPRARQARPARHAPRGLRLRRRRARPPTASPAWSSRPATAASAALVSVQGSLAMFAIWRWGSEEQKQEWLPRMAAGEAIGCFGLTEPDSGSDPGSMRTRARRDGDDWVLNGQKMWITNGSIADVAVVWARDRRGRSAASSSRRDTPGFTAQDIHRKLSLRASVTSELRARRRAAAGRRRPARGDARCRARCRA